jgi:hypothetical protein
MNTDNYSQAPITLWVQPQSFATSSKCVFIGVHLWLDCSS